MLEGVPILFWDRNESGKELSFAPIKNKHRNLVVLKVTDIAFSPCPVTDVARVKDCEGFRKC